MFRGEQQEYWPEAAVVLLNGCVSGLYTSTDAALHEFHRIVRQDRERKERRLAEFNGFAGPRICWTGREGKSLELHISVHKSENGHYVSPNVMAYVDGERSPGWYITHDFGNGIVAAVGQVGLTAERKKELDQAIITALAGQDLPVMLGLVDKHKETIRSAITACEKYRKAEKAYYLLSGIHPQEAAIAVHRLVSALEAAHAEKFSVLPVAGLDKLIEECVLAWMHNGRFERPPVIDEADQPWNKVPEFFSPPTPEELKDERQKLALREEFADFVEEWLSESMI